jgi:hypothetical protein
VTQLLDIPRDTAPSPSITVVVRKNRAWRRPELCVGLLALLLGTGFVAASLAWNGGRLFAPLDDVYIHLQYGRQLGSGHFFQFNSGDGISAGASSMLYAFVLGAVYAIGGHGVAFQIFAVAFGICCFAASAALTCALGTRLLHRTAGIWAGVLVATGGPLLWGAASGMEVGLVMVLVTATVLVLVIEQPAARFRFTPLLTALLALARPEGLIFATALAGAVVWTVWTRRRTNGILSTCGRSLWALLPLAFGAGQLLFYRLTTGTASANGVQSKSLLYDRPVLYIGEFLDRAAATLRSLLGHFLGFTSQDFAFPGALVLCCAGAGHLLWQDRIRRPLTVAVLIGLGAAFASLSTLDTALFHELRYYQPFFPLFLLFVVAGCHALCRIVSRSDVRRFALHGMLSLALVFSLVALPMWGVRFARAGAAIGGSDVSYAAWIRNNLPRDAVVAVKDVGAVAYLSDRQVVDLLGLGTNGFAKAANNGIGSLYERLLHLPVDDRPDYFATYDTGPGPSMAPLRDAGVLAEPAVAAFEVKTPPDLRNITAVPFRRFTIARADWSLAGNAEVQPVPGRLKDYLNVADLAAEEDHDYTYLPAETGMQPWTVLAHDDNIIASGRVVVGGEAFTLHDLIPGEPAVLTTRADIHGPHDLSVVVDGRTVGTWTREPGDGPWEYSSFTIPGGFITGPASRIELRRTQALSPYPDYISYGYWLTQ